MKVPRQLVSSWLSGDNEPSGEAALHLLEVAFDLESEKKRDARAVDAARALKARTQKNTTNEKPSPGRRQK
jgi:hypothetical protein